MQLTEDYTDLSLIFRTWVILSFVQKIGKMLKTSKRDYVKIEHGDISFLFDKSVCKVFSKFQCGKFLVAYVLKQTAF